MCDLVELLTQCERDTLEILGPRVAGQLATWESHRASQNSMIRFVQQRIHSSTWEIGATLELNKRLSLERIVVECGSDVFTDRDIELARDVLRMAPIVSRVRRAPK